MAPDAVVIATGSTNLTPRIPGLDPAKVLDPCDVLLGKVVTGKNVLVAGGGLIGAETADFLAEQRRNVTMIEMKPDFITDLDPYARPMLLEALEKQNVRMLANYAIQKFLPDGVTYKDVRDEHAEEKELRGFDSIVLALGHKSRNVLEDAIRDFVSEVYVVGDARQVDFVEKATHAGIEAGMKI